MHTERPLDNRRNGHELFAMGWRDLEFRAIQQVVITCAIVETKKREKER